MKPENKAHLAFHGSAVCQYSDTLCFCQQCMFMINACLPPTNNASCPGPTILWVLFHGYSLLRNIPQKRPQYEALVFLLLQSLKHVCVMFTNLRTNFLRCFNLFLVGHTNLIKYHIGEVPYSLPE